ncbi:MAG: hypothetical protein AAF749_04405 [Pseudomonadota bacterium]
MSNRKFLSAIILVPFSALTYYALMNGGIAGILSFHTSPGGWQVFVDLVIALLLVLTFLIPDAKARGRNPWLWVGLTVCLGSFGPLLYFLTGSSDRYTAVTSS